MPDELNIDKIKKELQKTFGEKDDPETPTPPPDDEEDE
jgi:hypothetical protein